MITTEIIKLCFEGLHNDSINHKQWFLEEILKIVTTDRMYSALKGDIKYGEWKEGEPI